MFPWTYSLKNNRSTFSKEDNAIPFTKPQNQTLAIKSYDRYEVLSFFLTRGKFNCFFFVPYLLQTFHYAFIHDRIFWTSLSFLIFIVGFSLFLRYVVCLFASVPNPLAISNFFFLFSISKINEIVSTNANDLNWFYYLKRHNEHNIMKCSLCH